MKNDIEDSASGDLLMEDDSTASGSGNEEVSASSTPLTTVTSTESNFLFNLRRSGFCNKVA